MMRLQTIDLHMTDVAALFLNELGDALKTSFQLDANPLKTPRVADEWEPYLAEKRTAVESLTREIADADAELNDRVFQLFHVTPGEIRLLQRFQPPFGGWKPPLRQFRVGDASTRSL